MSIVEAGTHVDAALSGDVIAHLELQLAAARRLLQIVLEQGVAIRARDVRTVVERTGLLQAELQRRGLLDAERSKLLERAGARLGVPAGAVTLTLMEALMDPASAQLTRARSSELKGLLDVLQREHYVNRALMNQELAFLDHLLRLAEGGETIYDAAGDRPAAVPSRAGGHRRMLDLEV